MMRWRLIVRLVSGFGIAWRGVPRTRTRTGLLGLEEERSRGQGRDEGEGQAGRSVREPRARPEQIGGARRLEEGEFGAAFRAAPVEMQELRVALTLSQRSKSSRRERWPSSYQRTSSLITRRATTTERVSGFDFRMKERKRDRVHERMSE